MLLAKGWAKKEDNGREEDGVIRQADAKEWAKKEDNGHEKDGIIRKVNAKAMKEGGLNVFISVQSTVAWHPKDARLIN